jgi:hypothetical protein
MSATTCANLTAFADGALTGDEADAFRVHLRDCDLCRPGLIEALQVDARLSMLQPQQPPTWAIQLALEAAANSPCRSKRGVVTYYEDPGVDGRPGVVVGTGHNGPPAPLTCPGRARCAGLCGQISVHAELRALRFRPAVGVLVDLVHVELGPDGGVVACDGPRCAQCSREILDVGFVAGVWLYELVRTPDESEQLAGSGVFVERPTWRRYAAQDFHATTLARLGLAR